MTSVSIKTRQTIFFILIFLIAFLGLQGSRWFNQTYPNKLDYKILHLIVGAVIAGCLIGVYYLADLSVNQENFWEVSLAAQCKGGPYFWGGDSELSKRCQELASTSEGRCDLSGYNCPKGYIGQPRQPFYYTPISDDNWKNERCDDDPTCPCVGDNLCSFRKQTA
jgi:hypothetical protein